MVQKHGQKFSTLNTKTETVFFPWGVAYA